MVSASISRRAPRTRPLAASSPASWTSRRTSCRRVAANCRWSSPASVSSPVSCSCTPSAARLTPYSVSPGKARSAAIATPLTTVVAAMPATPTRITRPRRRARRGMPERAPSRSGSPAGPRSAARWRTAGAGETDGAAETDDAAADAVSRRSRRSWRNSSRGRSAESSGACRSQLAKRSSARAPLRSPTVIDPTSRIHLSLTLVQRPVPWLCRDWSPHVGPRPFRPRPPLNDRAAGR